jgi:hypothetical protein
MYINENNTTLKFPNTIRGSLLNISETLEATDISNNNIFSTVSAITPTFTTMNSSWGFRNLITSYNTTQAKTNIHRTAPQEQLNPTMR